MKKGLLAFTSTLVLLLPLSGCTTTHFVKTVEVIKDADGKIVQTVERETVEQMGKSYDLKFNHLNKKSP
jgi:hypothetical protein